MNRAKRMKEARIAVNLSQAQVARLLGVSRTAVFKWESEGPNNTFPAMEHFLKCAQLYKKDAQWLMFGDSFSEKNDVLLQSPANELQGMRFVKIPIISWELAKKGKLAVSQLPKDHKDYLENVPSDREMPNAFALRIKNDSMVLPSPIGPSFQESDYIVINPDIINLSHQEYGLFLQKNAAEPIFRQFVTEGGNSYLNPLNNQYKKIEVTSEIEIIGRMMARVTPF